MNRRVPIWELNECAVTSIIRTLLKIKPWTHKLGPFIRWRYITYRPGASPNARVLLVTLHRVVATNAFNWMIVRGPTFHLRMTDIDQNNSPSHCRFEASGLSNFPQIKSYVRHPDSVCKTEGRLSVSIDCVYVCVIVLLTIIMNRGNLCGLQF